MSVLTDWLMFCIFTVRNEVAKVMFLQVSVCPGGSASVRAGIPHPPGADPPPGQTSSWEQTPPLDQTPPPPRTRHPPGTRPPPETATVADGMHPTGMHSCL